MMRFIDKSIFFLWGFCFSLEPALFDHLKIPPSKTEGHRIEGIDFIYVINLDRRPEKFQETLSELKPFGIEPYRFSAIDGWLLSNETINDVGLKYRPDMTSLFATSFPLDSKGDLRSNEWMEEYGKTYFAHGTSRGVIGCALSHISVLKDAWESGYETIWVMEDDIEVKGDLHRLSSLLEQLDALVGKEGWDVLLTNPDYRGPSDVYFPALGASKRPDLDCSFEARYSDPYTKKRQIHPFFKEASARFGAHSMIIRRSGIKKLLDFFFEHQLFLPYDLENYLPPELNRYALTFDLVTNRLGSITDSRFSKIPDFLK